MANGDPVPDKKILQQQADRSDWLWKWTGVSLAFFVTLLILKPDTPPAELIGSIVGLWLAAIGGKTYTGRLAFKDFRETDYGWGDKKAAIEAAKAGAPAPQINTNVASGGVATVKADGELK